MIDRYLLRYMLAVVDHGNFSRAAEQCGVSQPTLSVGIAKLEGLLGRSLFTRTNRRVAVTEAGVRFADHARRIEAEFIQAEHLPGSASARPDLRLGVLATLPSHWIGRLVRDLRAAAPEIRVELVEGRERALIDRLGRGRIDAALTVLRRDEARYGADPLFTEGYSLAMAADHPLAGHPTIDGATLASEPMIVRRHCEMLAEVSRHFTARGVRPFFAARTDDDSRALALVQAGLGVTVMPDGFAAAGVVRPRLKGFDATRRIGILRGRDVPAIDQAVLDTLRRFDPRAPASE